MLRRDLLKVSSLAIPGTMGQVAFGMTPVTNAQEPNVATFNVRTYGATGDGKTVDTPAINRAIEAAAGAGGGVIVFPAGIYVCFTIRLKSNIQIYLSPGCTVLAADSPRPGETTGYRGGTYDPAGPPQAWEVYQDYGHNHWPNSLFYGEDVSNVSIVGPGLIHGKGLSHGSKVTEHRGGYVSFQAEQAGVGNKAISLKNCHNVLLRDFSLLKGGHFAVLATGVDNLTLDNLRIDTDRDGFDIDCCRNVRVSNCTVNSPWDDAICPKSSYALGYARSTDNVTISNNYVTGTYELGSVIEGTWKKFAPEVHSSRNGRIKCGTESNGGFRNITITGNVLEGSKGIALETSDGALCEDIVIAGNTMRDTVDAPLFLRLNRRNRGPAETMRAGTLRRILISGLVSHHSLASTSCFLSGIAENLIEDVKISDCYFGHRGLPQEALSGWGNTSQRMPDWKSLQVPELESEYPELLRFGATPSHGFFIRHLRNLEMSHVEVAPEAADPRPAFHLEDVHRADFFAVTAPPQPNFSLKDVTDLRILWSRAASDITLAKSGNQTL
jgi:polygalacturonase